MLAMCIAAVFCLSITKIYAMEQDRVSVQTNSIFDGGTGTETDPYLIKSNSAFKNFAYSVRGTAENEYEDAESYGYDYLYNDVRYIRLEADLDFDSEEIPPVGGFLDGHSKGFCGNFNGNGHTISNFKIIFQPVTSFDAMGLFPNVSGPILGENNEVINLKVKDATYIIQHKQRLEDDDDDDFNNNCYIGGLVGSADNCIISQCETENITVKIDTTSVGNLKYDYYISGLVGISAEFYTTIIENCKAEIGDIDVSKVNDKSIGGIFVAGIYYSYFDEFHNLKIKNCISNYYLDADILDKLTSVANFKSYFISNRQIYEHSYSASALDINQIKNSFDLSSAGGSNGSIWYYNENYNSLLELRIFMQWIKYQFEIQADGNNEINSTFSLESIGPVPIDAAYEDHMWLYDENKTYEEDTGRTVIKCFKVLNFEALLKVEPEEYLLDFSITEGEDNNLKIKTYTATIIKKEDAIIPKQCKITVNHKYDSINGLILLKQETLILNKGEGFSVSGLKHEYLSLVGWAGEDVTDWYDAWSKNEIFVISSVDSDMTITACYTLNTYSLNFSNKGLLDGEEIYLEDINVYFSGDNNYTVLAGTKVSCYIDYDVITYNFNYVPIMQDNAVSVDENGNIIIKQINERFSYWLSDLNVYRILSNGLGINVINEDRTIVPEFGTIPNLTIIFTKLENVNMYINGIEQTENYEVVLPQDTEIRTIIKYRNNTYSYQFEDMINGGYITIAYKPALKYTIDSFGFPNGEDGWFVNDNDTDGETEVEILPIFKLKDYDVDLA